ncbi:MAG: hypothetical protein DRQ49_11110 [Gammaproteobacteria bacterium]|nr:MAG: hypothetical protein DRQ49_11110 [Gammaproteobacteria bacterium]RKZ43522.1 MAG: hypothetical protein DRQ41_05095 [Gammaproteobacteria bacterium]RKZ73316.1 MAG: hypothetical protein DRQ57_14715 [Gammaproteobacteria bacterium]
MTVSFENLHLKKLTIIILDTGCGIPPEQQPQIFKRFYRGEHQNILCSGLGLSIVQRIAELYHIEIQVKNMEKGLCVTTHF